MSTKDIKNGLTGKADYQCIILEKILQMATQNKLVIYGPYVHEVLAYRKAQLQPLNLTADINFWAKSIDDWHDFTANLGSMFDIIFDDDIDVSGDYQISILNNIICKGKLLISEKSHNIDIDIDLLVCDDFCELGVSLISLNNDYKSEHLIEQIVKKKFRIITDHPSKTLYHRQNKLYLDGWVNLTAQDTRIKFEESKKIKKILELLDANLAITTKLSNFYHSDDASNIKLATNDLVSQTLQILQTVYNILEILNK